MRYFKNAGGIYLPKFREIEVSAFKATLSGHITVDVIHARTGLIKQHLEMRNLITDSGLNGMASSSISSLITYCAVGTGNTAPANTDTGLVAEISTRTSNNAAISDSTSYVGGSPDYHKFVRTRQFDQTQANGNLTEIGFFSASAGGTMFSRQLFKDGTGTPTTVVKTSDDFLRITYEVRVYPASADTVLAAQNISGTNYTVTSRCVGVGQTAWNNYFQQTQSAPAALTGATGSSTVSAAALIARTADGSGGTFSTSDSVAGYVAGNFYKDGTTIYNTSAANFNILSMYFIANSLHAGYGIGFSPALAKDNTKQLTVNYRISWGRQP